MMYIKHSERPEMKMLESWWSGKGNLYSEQMSSNKHESLQFGRSPMQLTSHRKLANSFRAGTYGVPHWSLLLAGWTLSSGGSQSNLIDKHVVELMPNLCLCHHVYLVYKPTGRSRRDAYWDLHNESSSPPVMNSLCWTFTWDTNFLYCVHSKIFLQISLAQTSLSLILWSCSCHISNHLTKPLAITYESVRYAPLTFSSFI